MGFRIPNFNLTCNIYSGIGGAYPPLAFVGGAPRIAAQPCALAHGRIAGHHGGSGSGFTELTIWQMQLCLPALTDIRGFEENALNGLDQVECPAGSGRYYCVNSVDDVGKGYVNEYRCALIQAIIQTWTPPYP